MEQLTPFQIGVKAFESNVDRSANPYINDDDRTDWWRGWDWAKKMNWEAMK